ncbi:hypothetical protein BH10PSE19_BH10PSE19_17230 [soil metagenome]
MISETQIRDVLYKVTRSKDVYEWPSEYDFSLDSLDSLDYSTMALIIDEKYNIKISDKDLPELKSIKLVIDYLTNTK